MNLHEYKSNIIAQYTDKQQGNVMYRHHKLFDISNAIYKWLSIDLDSERLGYAHIDTILQELPKEYKEKYQIDFVKDMYKKSNTLEDVHKYNNKIAYFIATLKGKTRTRLLQTLELLPQDKSIVITDKDIQVKHYKGIHVIVMRDHIYRHISSALGFYKFAKDTIIVPFSHTEDTLEHEYQHAINTRIMPESNDKSIAYFVKDEYLAQMTEEVKKADLVNNMFILENHYFEKYINLFQTEGLEDISWQSVYIYKPLNEYLHRLSQAQQESISSDPNWDDIEQIDYFFMKDITGTPVLVDPNSPSGKKLQQIKDKISNLDMHVVGLFYGLQKTMYPKYYPNYEQFLYTLAITPLSQRNNLRKYYKRLENN